MALTSPVTGSAQTGFTSPTYTITADKFPGNNGVQYAITAWVALRRVPPLRRLISRSR